jgi:DNA-binding SARP family transcriptional activator/ATP/maltotriose-dependent transcriptional regulator MalT
MPQQASVSERFILQLAQGVTRSRLIEPVLAARPSIAIISAPSGYGKTVLAAQIASFGSFPCTVWVASGGSFSSAGDDLGRLADALTSNTLSASIRSCDESRAACQRALCSLADDQPVLVVIDDAPWAAEREAMSLLEMAMAEAPVGSLAVLTTRSECFGTDSVGRVWVIAPGQLLLSDAEVCQVWERHTGSTPASEALEELALASGRHVALLSLMARNASLMGGPPGALAAQASVGDLIDSLVSNQLDPDERILLDIAAILGEGDLASLQVLRPNLDTQSAIHRVARVLPLVAVVDSGERERFVVHDLVGKTRRAARAVAARDPGLLSSAVLQIAADGRHSRALHLAIASSCTEVLCHLLTEWGSPMLRSSSWERVVEALDVLGPATVVADPRLLIIRAEADWASGKRSKAIQTAQLAVRMEEVAGDGEVCASTRSVLARMRISVADFAGIVSDVAPLLERGVTLSTDEFADVLYAALAAYALQADPIGWAQCSEMAAEFRASGQASQLSLAQLDSVEALVALTVEGDPQRVAQLFQRSYGREGLPSHWMVSARGNLAGAALECGELAMAREALSMRQVGEDEYETEMDSAIRAANANAISELTCDADKSLSATERLLSLCEAEGERLTFFLTCQQGIELACAMGRSDSALQMGDRGLAAAAETGSPVLTWLAELLRAFALLASGDTDHPRAIAERILPRAQAISAMRHVLHARLILAEVAWREGDLERAVEEVRLVSDHIIAKSPALTVACYVRAFPELLGVLGLAMGVDRIPLRVLRLLPGNHGRDALDGAARVLPAAEVERLTARMRQDAASHGPQEGPPDDVLPAICEVRLFGGLHVKAPHGVVGERDWTKRKSRLLFSMLVARGGTDVPRGEIIDYLWPDMDEERGLSNFYVVWSAMKRALSPRGSSEQGSPFVQHAHGVCRIVGDRVISDLDQFKAALARARAAHANADQPVELGALRDALDLYRGDVLPGDVYDDWFGAVRERFKHDYEDAALRAGRLCTELSEPLEGLSILREASSRNPWREDLYQEMLKVQIATGQRAEAIETYLLCRSRLVDDLGIDPSRETVALYEQVLGMEESPEWGDYAPA